VIGLRGGSVLFDRPSTKVDKDLLQHLYAGHRQESRGIQDEDEFRRAFGCAR